MPNSLELCSLHARVAHRLGWTEEQVRSFSLPALRDLVRPVSEKLAHEITLAMRGIVQ
jgi:hypothetical protein